MAYGYGLVSTASASAENQAKTFGLMSDGVVLL